MKDTNTRNSSFELLRIISMAFIVYHHILGKIITKIDDSIIYKALDIPLHVAVICFILISGYFHIKPSSKAIKRLLYPIVIYYIPLCIYQIILDTCFFSRSLTLSIEFPYWFIVIYFFLLLISPLLNLYLDTVNNKLPLLVSLFFISVIMGTLQTPSLNDGKNLVFFMFVYVLGDCLKHYDTFFNSIHLWKLIAIYLFLNSSIVILYVIFNGNILSKIIWLVCYPYCSPILVLNAVILFLIISKIRINSKIINWLAGSVFAVYVIHHQDYILNNVIKNATMYIYKIDSFPPLLLLNIGVLVTVIMLCCIIIDKAIRKYVLFNVIK